MSKPQLLSRRSALSSTLKFTALAAATGLAGPEWFVAEAIGAPARKNSLRLGLTSYSLSNYPLDQAIKITKQLQLENVALFKAHAPWGGNPEECRAAADKLRAAGLTLTGTGVVELPNDEAALRKAFESARAAKLPTMVCKPALDAFPLVEKFVQEYDIRLAIHNHGPEDKLYPAPLDAWRRIQSYDKRIGLCIDVGHCARAGADPVAMIRKCAARLYDVHFKDSTAAVGATRDSAAVVGRGNLDIRGMLNALKKIKYAHVVTFEYEKRGEDQLLGLAESVGYVRGLLAA